MAMRDRLNAAVYGAKGSPIREFSRMAARREGCVRLTLGEPDFVTPEPICAAVGEALAAGETHYIENNGTAALREKIAAYERDQYGLDYAAGDVIVTIGANEALFVALFGILNPGDEVIVPAPAFVLYERIVGLCRGVYVPLDTEPDGFRIDAQKLEALITPRTKAIILNTPNNPTGCVYDRASLEAVRRAVEGRDIFVICDDVYRRLCYSGPCISFADYGDLREKILLVQSFSKPYAMTGWRVGCLLCDESVLDRLALVHQFAVTSAPAPFQRACMAALDYDPAPMLAEYRRRRDYVLARLEEMGLPTPRPEGAFYAFPSIARFGMDSTAFCVRLLEEAGVAVTPGAAFGANGHVRISYCCGMDALAAGMDRLAGFVRGLEDGR